MMVSRWSGWFERIARGGTRRRPLLRLHVLGMNLTQLRSLQPMCERASACLEVLMVLDQHQGDIVITDREFATRLEPQALARLCADRPLVTCDLAPAAERADSALALFERRQRELLRQLRELPAVRGISPQFSMSGWDPSVVRASELPTRIADQAPHPGVRVMDHDQALAVDWLRRGLFDPTTEPLVLGYDHGTVICVDFAQGFALVDPLAQQRLRVQRELPHPLAKGVSASDAIDRDLDLLVWDIGIAAGAFSLLHQPINWWHTPLHADKDAEFARYAVLPRHRALAQLLAARAMTPLDLQQRTGMAMSELRPFLQACMYLRLVHWSS